MTILTIVLLVALAIFLLVLELFIIPGISIAGIGAILVYAGAIAIAYIKLGVVGGNITLAASIISSAIAVYIFFKPSTWKRVTLSTEITAKVPEYEVCSLLKPGMQGVAKTRLGPMGEIEINDIITEAQSMGAIINANTPIEIVYIEDHKIFVKPLI
ncbi:MAG TPA: NfeD family protein [Bacteroidales bacterium]|nr:NfeD family protein [Bacteroidales bacterium]